MTQDGGKCLPPNCAVMTSDFSTNLKNRTNEYMSAAEWRAAEEFNLECQLINFKTLDEKVQGGCKKTRLSLDGQNNPPLQEFSLHFIGNTHKHDSHTHNHNFQHTLDFLNEKVAKLQIIFKNFDGSGKEYKGVPTFIGE